MKGHILNLLGVVGFISALAFTGSEMLNIGEKAPMTDYKMTDAASGDKMSLEDLKKKNGLLVIFSSNTCPFVLAWQTEYPKLGVLTAKNDIGMLLVNSNEAHRDKSASMEGIKKHHKEHGYNTPYVIDKNHKLADAFGAKTTPHVYLFDDEMQLVYRGSINDKFEDRDKEASKFYLNDAIEAMLNDQPVEPAATREIGCSIKRVKK